MAPRIATIKATLEKAIKQIDGDRSAAAGKTLEALNGRLTGKKRTGKVNAYASFVKANYARVSRANPGKAAPAIMKLIAKDWRAKH